jgi:hypothetical protein
MTTLTTASLELFLDLAKDAINWDFMPLFNEKPRSQAEKGNLLDLKKNNLLTTQAEGSDVFVFFTPAGVKLAQDHGVRVA